MVYSFEVGTQYRRRDVYKTIGIAEDIKGGNWDTGYNRHGDDWFIFCNIGVPGRTGHDYENAWVGKDLLWFGKINTRLTQPAIQSMLNPKGSIYIFTRRDSDSPFTFAGIGAAKEHKDTTPVTILWELRPIPPSGNTVFESSNLYVHSPMDAAHKRALVVAYYLSRCDKKGYQALGFKTWEDTYSQIGKLLYVPPSTVKQMRDSFDPYCSPIRKGWYQRPPVRSRVQVMEAYADVTDHALYEIARDVLHGKGEIAAVYTAPIVAVDPKDTMAVWDNLAYAARLRTGEAAEEYFKAQYSTLPQFKGMELEDARKLGSGFDFRVHGSGIIRAIEVKGIVGATGSIAFTDKEWAAAHHFKHDYILALVRSVDLMPKLELTVDPAKHLLTKRRTIESITVYWSAEV